MNAKFGGRDEARGEKAKHVRLSGGNVYSGVQNNFLPN